MIEKLNQILQGLIDRYSKCGTVYEGSVLTNAVPAKTSTRIRQLTLPAGTYVIAASTGYSKDISSVMTACSIYLEGTRILCTVRGTMMGGGGDCVTTIQTFDEDVTLSQMVYQGSTETVTASVTEFKAVRIK